jgi:hypothetical protein
MLRTEALVSEGAKPYHRAYPSAVRMTSSTPALGRILADSAIPDLDLCTFIDKHI